MKFAKSPGAGNGRRRRRVLALLALATLVVAAALPSIAGSTLRAGHGVLVVETSPQVPSSISVDGVPRNITAIRDLALPVGEHEVSFSTVEGYVAPAPISVTITEGETTRVVGEFSAAGTLEVTTEPASLAPTISVDGIERDRGATSLTVAVGEAEVCGSDLEGYLTPSCEVVAIVQGQTDQVTLSYTPESGEPKATEPSEPEDGRVLDGLVSFYDFAEGGGDKVVDRVSGLDLTIENPSAVSWTSEGLRFDKPTLARTDAAPSVIYDAVLESGEFTAEAWVTPGNVTQNGPARILSLGKDTRVSNFLIGQGEHRGGSDFFEGRHAREGEYRLQTDPGTLSTELIHVVMTRSKDGRVTLYLDGEMAAESTMPASVAGWDTSHRFGIGSELNGERPWLGTFQLIAVYSRALAADDVSANYAAGLNAGSSTDESTTPGDDEEDAGGDDPREAPGIDGDVLKLSRHGITWTFGREYEAGRYANGDYWVVGPVEIVDIDPASVTSSGRTVNGSMINPSPRTGSATGYGQTRDTGYNPDLNVADGISTADPLVVEPGSSLVSSVSTGSANDRPGLKAAAVLTVVDEPPPDNAFRPPYSGDDKSSPFTTDQLRFDLLPKLSPVANTPDLEELADRFERVWLDHVPGWNGRAIHPVDNMPSYGRDMAARLGRGSLALMLDVPDEQKERLLINYVQVGIDLYGIVEDGGEENWVPAGGHGQGRKWPILFAGTMLDDPAMGGIGDRDDVYFGEDGQTFYVTQTEIDRTDLDVMDPDHSRYKEEWSDGYTQDMLGMPEWGMRHATRPVQDTPDPSRSYRQCCTAASWHGHVLSARLMGLQDAWNHDAIFDYSDRYLGVISDPAWPELDPTGFLEHTDGGFTKNMWDTHR